MLTRGTKSTKRLRLLLATVSVVSTIVVFAPPAAACEFEGDPMCRPCGSEQINALTQKLYGEDLFHCPW